MTRYLTARETEVLRLVADGDSSKQIASILVISPHTVKSHRDGAVQKLGARNSAHAVAIAVREGLLT